MADNVVTSFFSQKVDASSREGAVESMLLNVFKFAAEGLVAFEVQFLVRVSFRLSSRMKACILPRQAIADMSVGAAWNTVFIGCVISLSNNRDENSFSDLSAREFFLAKYTPKVSSGAIVCGMNAMHRIISIYGVKEIVRGILPMVMIDKSKILNLNALVISLARSFAITSVKFSVNPDSLTLFIDFSIAPVIAKTISADSHYAGVLTDIAALVLLQAMPSDDDQQVWTMLRQPKRKLSKYQPRPNEEMAINHTQG